METTKLFVEVKTGATEIVEDLGQQWQKCLLQEIPENCITVKTEQGERLILVRLERFQVYGGKGHGGGFRVVPVTSESLESYKAP